MRKCSRCVGSTFAGGKLTAGSGNISAAAVSDKDGVVGIDKNVLESDQTFPGWALEGKCRRFIVGY